MNTTRMSTLVKKLGMPTASFKMVREDYAQAVNEGRVLTIHHPDDGDGPNYGIPGHNIVNADWRLVFNRPIPQDVEYVVGIKPEHLG